MTAPAEEGSVRNGWSFEAVVFGTFGLLLFFMVGGRETGIYLAGLVGTIASTVLGWYSVRRGWVSVSAGIRRFATRWFYVVGFAALSLMNGKWEPMVFAAVVGVTLTGFYALGARSARGPQGGPG